MLAINNEINRTISLLPLGARPAQESRLLKPLYEVSVGNRFSKFSKGHFKFGYVFRYSYILEFIYVYIHEYESELSRITA